MAENKAMSKSAVFADLAEKTGLTRKQVAHVFEELSNLIRHELGKKGPGVFNVVPGMLQLKLKRLPATKAGSRPNPFRPGEMMEVKAKPARNQVKPRALKALKELVK
jgi:nucleoid DNA-binding protein